MIATVVKGLEMIGYRTDEMPNPLIPGNYFAQSENDGSFYQVYFDGLNWFYQGGSVRIVKPRFWTTIEQT